MEEGCTKARGSNSDFTSIISFNCSLYFLETNVQLEELFLGFLHICHKTSSHKNLAFNQHLSLDRTQYICNNLIIELRMLKCAWTYETVPRLNGKLSKILPFVASPYENLLYLFYFRNSYIIPKPHFKALFMKWLWPIWSEIFFSNLFHFIAWF